MRLGGNGRQRAATGAHMPHPPPGSKGVYIMVEACPWRLVVSLSPHETYSMPQRSRFQQFGNSGHNSPRLTYVVSWGYLIQCMLGWIDSGNMWNLPTKYWKGILCIKPSGVWITTFLPLPLSVSLSLFPFSWCRLDVWKMHAHRTAEI